ncbi:MAG: AAA family ATPase [Candidatus Latescibacterota bacterium]
MVPVKLRLKNFMSYGENVPPLDFSRFHMACLSGNNGHGKSALLDAITWALWGEGRKASGDRKPDEGLLRIGTTEMQVEFEFDLEGDHYRVLRGYRKAARAGMSSLELQILDETTGGYLPLSESSSVTKTQHQINRLLRMDYDTFINSAFILQGRADEFTRRSARDRKVILADILGLSRYDELMKLARSHTQESDRACTRLAARLEEIDAELAHKETYEQEMARISGELALRSDALRSDESALAKLTEARNDLQNKSRRMDDLKREMVQSETAISELRNQLEEARKEMAEYQGILERKEQIVADFRQYETLLGAERKYTDKLRVLKDKGEERRPLEQAIAQERSDVERRKEIWESRRADVEKMLQEAKPVLGRQQKIEEGFVTLRKAQEADGRWEEKWEQIQQLEQARKELRKRIDAAREEIQVQLRTVEGQLREAQAKAKAELAYKKESEDFRAEIRELEELDRARQDIREEGTALRMKMDTTQGQIPLLEAEISDTEGKLSMLRANPEAHCPLCQSDLDEGKRVHIEDEYSARIAERRGQIDRLQAALEQDDRARIELRARYKDAEERIQALPEKRQTLARAEEAYREAILALGEIQKRKKEIEALQRKLAEKAFLEGDQRRWAEMELELQRIGYDPERHQAARKAIREFQHFAAEHAELESVRAQHTKAQERLPEIDEKISTATEFLRDKRYAQKEQERLTQLLLEIEGIGYLEADHRQIHDRLEQLSESRVQRDRLTQAEERIAGARRVVEALEHAIEDRLRSRQNSVAEQERLVEEVGKLGEVIGQITRLEEEVSTARKNREELLSRRGGVQNQYDRCVQVERDRIGVKMELGNALNDRGIYEKLTVAFGKDGIQALIIEGAIPEIEEEANDILGKLTENRTQISIEPLRDLKSGGTKETLDIKISDEMGTRSYELYSGGEAFRTDFALRIALSKLLARRAGTRLRTLVIDEGFGTQDNQGLEHLIQAIQSISEDFDKIIVVTHLEILKNAFPVRIEVVKESNVGSTYELIG